MELGCLAKIYLISCHTDLFHSTLWRLLLWWIESHKFEKFEEILTILASSLSASSTNWFLRTKCCPGAINLPAPRIKNWKNLFSWFQLTVNMNTRGIRVVGTLQKFSVHQSLHNSWKISYVEVKNRNNHALYLKTRRSVKLFVPRHKLTDASIKLPCIYT